MKGMGGFVIGLILGIGIMWLINGGPRGGGNSADGMLKVSAKDTVIVSAAKYDTVIVSAQKDTVIVSVVDDDYCDRKPRPPECPPKVHRAMQTR